MGNTIKSAAKRLDVWIEREQFKGWDPYDALNSPALKLLMLRSRRMGQAWVQLLKLSPFNFRPFLRVPKGHNPKGMGLFLASYIRKYQSDRTADYSERIRFFAKWLQTNISVGYSGMCWGYNFDWPNRGFFAPAKTPTIVNTAFIGLAFIDLSRLLGSTENLDLREESIRVARSACEFIRADLHVHRPSADEMCFSYTPLDHRWIHNANVLGAWLLSEVAAATDDHELLKLSLCAARYTTRRQAPDGSWPYGVATRDCWIDNFHTGYVLVALSRVAKALQTNEFEDSLTRGYSFWKSNFLTSDSAPKYYPNRAYPYDAHCAAQAVLTLLEFSDRDPKAVDMARRIAQWSIAHMQCPDGSFAFQIHPHVCIRIPYMRWTQAWMQRAFAELQWRKVT